MKQNKTKQIHSIPFHSGFAWVSIFYFSFVISGFLLVEPTYAQTPPCNDTFTNKIHCVVNVQVVITCGGTSYTYTGTAPSANCGSPQIAPLTLMSTPQPPNCNFSGCGVTLTINGQSKSGTFGTGAINMDVECVPGSPCGGGFNKMSVHFNLTAPFGTGSSFTTICCTP